MLDQATIERLYQEMERPLFNIALRWTWNEAEAHELVQDAFLRLWSARWRVREETVSAYIYRMVINLGQKHARRRETGRRLLRLLADAGRSRQPDADYDEGQVRRVIQSLPDDQRSVLLLCEYSDLKQREIAALLDIPAGTVASRRNLALKKLKEALDESS